MDDHADISLGDAIWEERLERAARRGAAEALKSIGLGDEQSVTDIAELRSLARAWRDMRREVLRTTTRWVTMALLGLILLAVGAKCGFPGFGSGTGSWTK